MPQMPQEFGKIQTDSRQFGVIFKLDNIILFVWGFVSDVLWGDIYVAADA